MKRQVFCMYVFVMIMTILTGCATITTGLNKANTDAKGATAYPDSHNMFQGLFEYQSFAYLKSQITPHTSLWYSYFHNSPYLTPKEADEKISKLPKGGIIKIEHLNSKFNINGVKLCEKTIIDSVKLFLLADSSVEVPFTLYREKRELSNGYYNTSAICMVNNEVPDSFYVKNWIRYKGDSPRDSGFTNSWKVYLNRNE